ncbi:MAG: hypothetical protein LUH02_07940 [Erysipelotrichaceae bacterium]|nr:hypothetical protein [Erysipelotrichaceae bacterium]
MKMTYIKPTIETQLFTPNEYVAACGDSGTVYNFECNAGSSNKSYYIHDGNGNYQTISGYYLGPRDSSHSNSTTYHPCGTTHEAESNSGFLTGYYLDDSSTTRVVESIPVIIWTANNTNVHCTTNLDMSSWSIAKS